MAKVITNLESDFDFGFSFSDGTDIPEIKSQVDTAHAVAAVTSDRLQTVLSMVNNFLDNLSKEPEKKYLLWPDRAAKVKAFQDKLNGYAN